MVGSYGIYSYRVVEVQVLFNIVSRLTPEFCVRRVLHGKYKALRAAQNRQLLNFQSSFMDLRAQETLFGGPEKWQRIQLQQPAVPVPPAGTAVSTGTVHDT